MYSYYLNIFILSRVNNINIDLSNYCDFLHVYSTFIILTIKYISINPLNPELSSLTDHIVDLESKQTN